MDFPLPPLGFIVRSSPQPERHDLLFNKVLHATLALRPGTFLSTGASSETLQSEFPKFAHLTPYLLSTPEAKHQAYPGR